MNAAALSIVPMPVERVRAYFREFSDWYAEALLDFRPDDPDGLHAEVIAYLAPYLDGEGLPRGSQVFDLRLDSIEEPVGATWCGGANLGFGEILYVHDQRVHPPFRRRGIARRALSTLHGLACSRGAGRGLGLSVLAQNAAARELYRAQGFMPLSHVLFKPFPEIA
jgi:ribosomal protein S18 acetylase RimI-like enzyme